MAKTKVDPKIQKEIDEALDAAGRQYVIVKMSEGVKKADFVLMDVLAEMSKKYGVSVADLAARKLALLKVRKNESDMHQILRVTGL